MSKRLLTVSLGMLLLLAGWFAWFHLPEPANSVPAEIKLPERDVTSRKLLVDHEASHVRVPPAPTPQASPLSSAEWMQQRDAILSSTEPTTEKAAQLRDLLPRLSEMEEVEATKHMLNLLSDDQFPTIGELITNAQTPNAVQELMFNDSLNRPERVKYPIWLSVARTPDNPRAETARNMLVATLPQDCGTNWAAWETQIQSRLQPGQ